MFLTGSLVNIVRSLIDQEVACSTSDLQGSNFESCVWRAESSLSSHYPEKLLLAQFSLYVHTGGRNPRSFIHSFIYIARLILDCASSISLRVN